MKALVAVELQLRGDLLLFVAYCLADGVQYQIHSLLRTSLVGYTTIVVQVPDHEKIQYTPFGLDIGDVGHLFAVRCFGMKVPVEQIFIFV